MRKIERRAMICLIIAFGLFIGICTFGYRFIRYGSDWASFPANKHSYANTGTVKDRDGDILSEVTKTGRTYYPNETVRKATLHVVGDKNGSIGTGAITAFSSRLSGYNLLTGSKSLFETKKTLNLTIDAAFNVTAYKALNGKKGTVAVYDYITGEILCLVSTPSFDPQNPPTDTSGENYEGVYLNRFLSSSIIPGSIFKIVTLNAALENIPDIYNKTWNCTGSKIIGGAKITCPRAHGKLNITSAFANSCNGVFGELASEIGGQKMQYYVEKAGLTSSVSVDGIKTAKGSFFFEGAEKADIAWGGVGQGKDSINPCSMLTYVGAIASNGSSAIPKIIKSVEGSILPDISTTKRTDTLINPETAKKIKEMMKNNVVSIYGANRFPENTCAKSGTAEVGGGLSPHAWFTGFIDDIKHPYAFIVLVENGGGGSRVAGSIASTVLNAIVEKMNKN